MNKILSLKTPLITTNEELYTCYLFSVAMYAYETRPNTQGDEDKLLKFLKGKFCRKCKDIDEIKMKGMKEKKIKI